jgi:inorganic triphosphatase YgiF
MEGEELGAADEQDAEAILQALAKHAKRLAFTLTKTHRGYFLVRGSSGFHFSSFHTYREILEVLDPPTPTATAKKDHT